MLGIWVWNREEEGDWLRNENGQPVTFEEPYMATMIAITSGAIRYVEWEAREYDQ